MDVYYINLAGDTARRAAVEANFADAGPEGWRLHRIEAVGSAEIAQNPVRGAIRDGEKGCFLSHRKALEAARGSDGHIFIAEDDIQFGRRTGALVDAALKSLPEHGWDIIYTDVIVHEIAWMVHMYLVRSQQLRLGNDKPQLIDLRGVPFAGSIGYLVNRHAREKLLRLMRPDLSLDAPYDIFLRQQIHSGALRGSLLFPFVTTQSSLEGGSTIQPGTQSGTDAIWTAFRQLVWQERDLDQVAATLAPVRMRGHPDGDALARIIALMLSPDYAGKG
jgi:GR25 family glycosyltransferase involved in LPS biosynthesis